MRRVEQPAAIWLGYGLHNNPKALRPTLGVHCSIHVDYTVVESCTNDLAI